VSNKGRSAWELMPCTCHGGSAPDLGVQPLQRICGVAPKRRSHGCGRIRSWRGHDADKSQASRPADRSESSYRATLRQVPAPRAMPRRLRPDRPDGGGRSDGVVRNQLSWSSPDIRGARAMTPRGSAVRPLSCNGRRGSCERSSVRGRQPLTWATGWPRRAHWRRAPG
jgi:hypothetical protein